jgi:hypothetical protein
MLGHTAVVPEFDAGYLRHVRARHKRIGMACILAWLVAAPAAAQTAPTRAMFELAVLSEAASVVPARPCDEEEDEEARPELQIPRAQRAELISRQRSLPESTLASGVVRRRRVALVRVATGVADPNDAFAYALYAVALRSDGEGPWVQDAHTKIELGTAAYFYGRELGESELKIFRLRDLDDDGEVELQIVLETNTQVQCGTGYCSVRRTVLLDTRDEGLPVVANVTTRMACQAAVLDQYRGTVIFRDTNADGHRDLVVRRRVCVYSEELQDRRCAHAVSTTYRWAGGVDRYEPRPYDP